MANCKLCGQDKELLKRSHIIPDFMYRNLGLFNNNHQLYRINVQEYLESSEKVSLLPNGEYEGGLLCSNCDNVIIGQYENYAKRVLFGGTGKEPCCIGKNFRNPIDGQEISVFEHVDFLKFKLFLLSILWRASISSRPIFSDVSIASNHETIIRNMLLSGNPGEVGDYPIIALSYLNDSSLPKDFIGQPRISEDNGMPIITFLIGGIALLFCIASGVTIDRYLESQSMKTDNTFTLIHLPQGEGWNFILRFTGVKK